MIPADSPLWKLDINNLPLEEPKGIPREHLNEFMIKVYMDRLPIIEAESKKSLFEFNRRVLKVEKGGTKVKLAPFHQELCDFVQNNRNKKKLILVPRSHLKSTLITVGYSLFRIIENVNIRILILNATYQMACDFLTEIKDHLQKNDLLKDIWGDLSENAPEWSKDRIAINRTNTGIKGPTVWAAGVESNLVGSHPDLIIMDDLVNRDTVQSEELSNKVILRYKDAIDLLEPGGQLIVIGTRWSDRDLYEWLTSAEYEGREDFQTYIKPAFKTDFSLGDVFKMDEGETLITDHLWPEKFNYTELKSRYNSKGPYEFSSQYLNNPVPDDSADFRREWFRYCEPDDWKGKITSKFMTIDPALSLKKEADSTGIIITQVDPQGNIFPMFIDKLKIIPADLIKYIFQLYEVYRPNIVGIEIVAFQKILSYSIREQMKLKNRYFPITEIKSQDKSKVERVRSLQPLYASGKIFHSKAVKNTNLLEDELLRFPRGKHDDLADALSMQLELIVPPRIRKDNKKNHYLYGNQDRQNAYY